MVLDVLLNHFLLFRWRLVTTQQLDVVVSIFALVLSTRDFFFPERIEILTGNELLFLNRMLQLLRVDRRCQSVLQRCFFPVCLAL